MAQDPLIGATIGSYAVQSKIGVGGMGAVYMGVHPLIGKRVAIKVLHAEFADKQDVVQRFFQEARAVSLLRHPHIVELIDFGKLDSSLGSLHYCVMELLEGELLRETMQRGPIPEAKSINWACQMADAVGAAHKQHIIHRDLKPENVFLVGAGKDFVKILDFGIAKLTGQNAASMQTQAGTLLGTPSYMSPEQCMARPVDARSDVYALGIILFEMCTGRAPFVGEGYADLLIKQINGELPSPRSINPALSQGIERVIARALEKDPAARFQSMDEFAAAMQAPSQVPGPTQLMGTAKADDQTVVGASAPTTLQSAASEMRLAMPTQMGEAHGGGRGLGAVLGVGAGLVVAAVVLGVVLLRDPRAGGTTTDPSHDPGHDVVDPQKGHKDDPPPQKKMHLHVTSEPPGAVVKRDDGSALGPTPLDVDLAADGSMLKLVLHKEGFKDEVRALILSDRDRSLAFRLTSNAPKEEPKEEKPKKPRTPKKPPPELHLGDDILPPKL